MLQNTLNAALGYDDEISERLHQLKQSISSHEKADRTEVMKLSQVYNERGFSRYLMVDFYPAIEDYSESILLNPDNPIAFYNRGLVRYRLGIYQESKQDLEMCVQLDPGFVEAKHALDQVSSDIKEGRTFGQ